MIVSRDTDSLFPDFVPDTPDFEIEKRAIVSGAKLVAGVDEVGRGPLAGPVVAAAVILDPENIPDGLNDSKKLSEIRREEMFNAILLSSHVAWTSLNAETIDQINIREAALTAMVQSVHSLELMPDHVLIDGRDIPPALVHVGKAYVKGDARSVSIAAASIVAKVIRDRMMKRAEEEFPGYKFASNKGYAAKVHLEAIKKLGPCPLHRKSFSPVKQMVSE